MKNLTNEAYRFNMRCMSPMVIPFNFALLYMIQSGEYIFAPEFISSFKKLHMDEAAALWQMIHYPTKTTMHQLQCLIFDGRTYGYNVTLRYCDDKFRLPTSTFETRFTSSIQHYENNVNKAQNLVQYCRNNPRPEGSPQHLKDDFIPLNDNVDDDQFFTLDTDGDSQHDISEAIDHHCPPHLHEMLSIVAAVRTSIEDKKQNLLPSFSKRVSLQQENHSQQPSRSNLMSSIHQKQTPTRSNLMSFNRLSQTPTSSNLMNTTGSCSSSSSSSSSSPPANKLNLLQPFHENLDDSDSDSDGSY